MTYGLTLGQELERAIEKPKLEHARDLIGIYSIDPSEEEHKDIRHHKKRKTKVGDTNGSCNAMQELSPKLTFRKVVFQKQKAKTSEVHKSTRQEIESVTKRIHEEHIAGKRREFRGALQFVRQTT